MESSSPHQGNITMKITGQHISWSSAIWRRTRPQRGIERMCLRRDYWSLRFCTAKGFVHLYPLKSQGYTNVCNSASSIVADCSCYGLNVCWKARVFVLFARENPHFESWLSVPDEALMLSAVCIEGSSQEGVSRCFL